MKKNITIKSNIKQTANVQFFYNNIQHDFTFFFILFYFYICVKEIIKKPTLENKSGKIAMKKKK